MTAPQCPSRRAVSARAATSHSRIVLSQELEASLPSGMEHRAATAPEGPSRRAVSAPAATSHSRIVLSQELEASLPSGMEHRAATAPECPSRRAVSAPAARSHSRIVLSQEPEASLPSGMEHRAATPRRNAPRAPRRLRLGAGSRGEEVCGLKGRGSDVLPSPGYLALRPRTHPSSRHLRNGASEAPNLERPQPSKIQGNRRNPRRRWPIHQSDA